MGIRSQVWWAVCGAVLAGCGGGGGGDDAGGAVSGLSLPSRISVVTAAASGPAGDTRLGPAAVTAANFPATSDYARDAAESYVYDESMASLQTVNMILCLMAQTRAGDMVNSGAYYALVNEDKCEQGQGQSGAASGQSGTVAQLNAWTVESTRASNSDPMQVRIWIPDNREQREHILVDLSASAGVGGDNPFGVFSMNFRGVDAQTSAEMMSGSLNASGLGFAFFSAGGGEDYSYSDAARVVFENVTGSSGMARTARSETDGGNAFAGEYALDFDAGHVLRTASGDGGETACLARDEFTANVWRYNLYYRDSGNGKTAGQRVALNSGFPFTYTANAGQRSGHVGYFGIWLEGDTTLPDGATITRRDYGSQTSTDYTVQVSTGKLIERTAQSLSLAKLTGLTLYYWGRNPDTDSYGQWQVAVANNRFAITAAVTFGANGPEATALATPVDITPAQDGENLWLWSDALGGNLVYVHDSASATPTVTFYAERYVQPDDATLFGSASSRTLYCYDRCLKGGLTQNAVNAMGNEADLYYPGNGTAYQYTLQVSGGKLALRDTQNNNALVDATGLDLSAPALGHGWGVQTGEMLLSSAGINHPWEVYQQAVTYRWETGANAWNRLVTVRDAANTYVQFDRPRYFTYTVDAGDDLNSDAQVGNTYLLQYGGPGHLWGFPHAPSGDGLPWYATVNLRDGVELFEDGGGTPMVVRPIEMEQRMNAVDVANCAGLDTGAAAVLDLPAAASGSVTFTWSDRPVPNNAAPAVIEGELQ